MKDLATHIHPVRNGSLIKLHFFTERAEIKAPSFLTGFTQIALTRQGSIHLLSMALKLSD